MNLTSEQLAIIEDQSHRLAIIAGPGAAKTETLVRRIGHFISHRGVSPKDIVAITFTTAAARELERRIDTELDYAGTLHGFVLRMLTRSEKFERIAMINEKQKSELIKESINTLKMKLSQRDALAALDCGPDAFLDGFDEGAEVSRIFAAHYYGRLFREQILDYDSLLKFGIAFLRQNASMPPLPAIFWDEFQDASRDDLDILQMLPADNITIVMDPDQAIFSFRDRKESLELSREWKWLKADKEWKWKELSTNFRCAEPICRAANSLISHNTGRFPKETIPIQSGVEVTVTRFKDETSECAAIANAIKDATGSIGILFRTKALMERMGDSLTERNIHFNRLGQIENDSPQWQLIIQLVNLMANPNNEYLTYSYFKSVYGTEKADEMKLGALRNRKPLRWSDYVSSPYEIEEVPAMLNGCGVTDGNALQIVNRLIEDIPAGLTLAEKLNRLAAALGSRRLASMERTEAEATITLSTIHSAKGLEFDTIFLPAFEQGILPLKGADISEERRVAFVGITRARSRLFISHAETRAAPFPPHRYQEAEPSQFIKEAGL